MKIDTPISYADWRNADQKYYVSNIHKVTSYESLHWHPVISVDEGLVLLNDWILKYA